MWIVCLRFLVYLCSPKTYTYTSNEENYWFCFGYRVDYVHNGS